MQNLSWTLPELHFNYALDLLSLILILRADFPDKSWTCFVAMDFSGHLDSRQSTAAMPRLCHSPLGGAVGLVLLGEATALQAKASHPHSLLLPAACSFPHAAQSCKQKNKKKKKNLFKKGERKIF